MAYTFGCITISVLLLVCFRLVNCLPDDPSSTYEILYEKGLKAYKDGNWFACASYLNRSIQDYKYFVETVTDCRLNCKKSVISAKATGINFELNYYRQLMEISGCLRRCKKKKLGKRPEIPAHLDVDKKFKDRMPYNYLQFCYIKLEKNKEAVATAYTYFIMHQNDQMIIDNLMYYRGLEGVTDEDFKDLHRHPYQNAYESGLYEYYASDWKRTIEHMEESLRLYFEEEKKCRAACEGLYSHKAHTDFTNAVADHFLVVLVCQYKCEEKLSVFGNEYLPNFVSEHYNYLQFAYFHMKDVVKAVKAVATFLLFQPHDEDMLWNKAYYSMELGFYQEDFIPFEEAEQYYERRKIFTGVINDVKTEYALYSDKIMAETIELSQRQAKEFVKKLDEGRTIKPSEVDNTEILQQFYDQGVKIIKAGEKDLLGRERFVADALVTEEVCAKLINLTKKGGLYGDGYGGTSPNDENETFLGLNLYRASKLVEQGVISKNVVQLTLDVSEMSRHLVEIFLNLSHPLYFDFTHLVCRAAKREDAGDRSDDLSHEVHADNCHIQPDGTCVEQKELKQRHYSAILYLNEDIEGGDFFFAYPNKSVQVSVRPKCGRLVGFNSGEFHGVQAVLKGQRCALAMWYTMDPNYIEATRIYAKRVSSKMEGEGTTATITEKKYAQNTVTDDEIKGVIADEVQNNNADDPESKMSSASASKETKDSDAEHTENKPEVRTSKEINSSKMEVKSTAKEKEEL